MCDSLYSCEPRQSNRIRSLESRDRNWDCSHSLLQVSCSVSGILKSSQKITQRLEEFEALPLFFPFSSVLCFTRFLCYSFFFWLQQSLHHLSSSASRWFSSSFLAVQWYLLLLHTHTHSRADENLGNQKGIFVFISFGEICNLHCFVFFVSWLSDFLACRFMFLCTPKFVAFCFLLYVHTHTRARQITTVCMFRVCVSGFVFFRCASLKQQQQFGIE